MSEPGRRVGPDLSGGDLPGGDRPGGDRTGADLPSDAAVEAFLRARPSWLAQRPGLHADLEPPQRVHGEAVADHMAAMLRVERGRTAAAAQAAVRVVEDRRAAAGLAGRVRRAVLALIATADPAECVATELPGLLGVDAAVLCSDGEDRAGLRRLPTGTIARLLGGRDVVVRADPADARLLHVEAAPLARHDALVRVPSRPDCLLLLASRDAGRLCPDREALAFLGQALAAAMARGGL